MECFGKILNIFKNFGNPDYMSNFSVDWMKK